MIISCETAAQYHETENQVFMYPAGGWACFDPVPASPDFCLCVLHGVVLNDQTFRILRFLFYCAGQRERGPRKQTFLVFSYSTSNKNVHLTVAPALSQPAGCTCGGITHGPGALPEPPRNPVLGGSEPHLDVAHGHTSKYPFSSPEYMPSSRITELTTRHSIMKPPVGTHVCLHYYTTFFMPQVQL